MALLDRIPHGETVEQHRPWPRALVGDEGWTRAIELLGAGRCTLLGLWGDGNDVHMALLDETAGEVAVVSYACSRRKYPSVAARHPPGGTPRTRDPRSVRPGGRRRARCAALARSRLLGRAPSARQRRACGKAHALPVPAGGRRGACTRSRSVRCMPASSSPAISASPPMASMSCGWSSGSATCTRASNRLMTRRGARCRRQTRRAHLRRQHGRLFLCLRAGRRGSA